MAVAELTAASSGVDLLGRSSDMVASLRARLNNAFFHGAEAVQADGCEGVLAFAVAPAGPFSVPVPGQVPPAVLYRLFLPNDTSA